MVCSCGLVLMDKCVVWWSSCCGILGYVFLIVVFWESFVCFCGLEFVNLLWELWILVLRRGGYGFIRCWKSWWLILYIVMVIVVWWVLLRLLECVSIGLDLLVCKCCFFYGWFLGERKYFWLGWKGFLWRGSIGRMGVFGDMRLEFVLNGSVNINEFGILVLLFFDILEDDGLVILCWEL